ncbi:hypothetical protein L1887_13708 [Cichorium endivia]|nr:hypothetical protein L1887_13708 [Cichorium endivia]
MRCRPSLHFTSVNLLLNTVSSIKGLILNIPKMDSDRRYNVSYRNNTSWKIRDRGVEGDGYKEYDGDLNKFSLEINHGGHFVTEPKTAYLNGKVSIVDYLRKETFSLFQLDSIVKALGYRSPDPVYYHFRLPLVELERALIPMCDEADVLRLYAYTDICHEMEIYVEHGKSLLTTYGRPPLQDYRVDYSPPVSPEMNTNSPDLPANSTTRKQLTFDLNTMTNSAVDDTLRSCVALVQGNENGLNPVNVENGGNSTELGESSDPFVDLSPVHAVELHLQDPPGIETYDELYEFGCTEPGLQWELEDDYGFNLEATCAREYTEAVQNVNLVTNEPTSFREPQKDYEEEDPQGNASDGEPFVYNRQEDSSVEFDINMRGYGCVLDPEEPEVFDTNEFRSYVKPASEREALLRNLKKPVVCSEGTIHEVDFFVGETFANKNIVKEAVLNLGVIKRRKLVVTRNETRRLSAKCVGIVPGLNDQYGMNPQNRRGRKVNSQDIFCTWALHVSWSEENEDWLVKCYNPNHTCLQTRQANTFTQGYIAKRIQSQVAGNPSIPVSALRAELQRKFKLDLSYMKVFRTKQLALNKIRGDYERQYSMLRDYGLELQLRNPGTTVKIAVEDEPDLSSTTRVFKRIYICLGALKSGFKASKREILGLDGAFMKGPYPGQLLSAVGMDGNNGIYPLAYAIVETENKSSWTWFLEQLGEDLDMGPMTNFTFVSDRQKGLLPAVSKVFPVAEHRFCIRHIHENMKLHFKSPPLKEQLWICATTTTEPQFRKAMAVMNGLNKDAYKWPIISALEFVREYMMRKIVIVQKMIEKSSGVLTPTAQKLLDKVKEQASMCTCIFNGGGKYQVTSDHYEQFIVDMHKGVCSCRKWEVSGIPCKHAVAALWDQVANGELVSQPEDLVHPCYRMETWKRMYCFKIEPINGPEMWPKSPCPTTILPPKHHVQVGRPQVKRRRGIDEYESQGSQQPVRFTTSRCKSLGLDEVIEDNEEEAAKSTLKRIQEALMAGKPASDLCILGLRTYFIYGEKVKFCP